MSNIFKIVNHCDAAKFCDLFSAYREEALKVLGDMPTLTTEQYRLVDVKAIFQTIATSNVVSGEFSLDANRQDGVVVRDIASFASEYKDIFLKHFGTAFRVGAIEQPIGTKFKDRNKKRSFFVDLNSAFLGSGVGVYVPPNCSVVEPIDIDIDCEDVVLGRRDIIIVDKFSKATIKVNNISKHRLLNRVCEIYLCEGASLELIDINLQNNSQNTFNNIAVVQGKGSSFRHFNIIATDKIIRTNIKVILDGTEANAQLYGTNLAFGKAEISVNSVMEHNKAYCTSYEHYKNVVTDNSLSDFEGIIFVNKDAQKTNAVQRNDNVVLVDTARAFAKPQLEIYADDVKCTHGATVGGINQDALFYMMQRGISSVEAHKLLLTGFLTYVVMDISDEKSRDNIIKQITDIILSVQ